MVVNFLFIWAIVTAGVFAFWAAMDQFIPPEKGDLTVADFPFHVQLIGNGVEALALTIVGFLIFYYAI